VAIEVDDRLKNPSLPIPAWRAVPEDKLYIGILCRATRVIKAFFFEKKTQQTSAHCGLWQRRIRHPQEQKFFASFLAIIYLT
jgi:hypothetical protein